MSAGHGFTVGTTMIEEGSTVKNRQGFEEKSRLGRLLVNRGYLSDSQLEEGLKLQRESGKRLGEVFVQAGWITERELHRVLKHQSRYRNAAALVTMVVLPFQPMISFASGNQSGNDQGAADAAQMVSEGKFKPMTDAEMSGVTGQADAGLFGQFAQVSSVAATAGNEGGSELAEPDAVETLKFAANLFVPVLNFLDSELTVSGVHYSNDQPRLSIGNDGAVTVAFPERIDQIRMDNIRVMGSGQSMGNIIVSDLRFHGGTSMTIRTR